MKERLNKQAVLHFAKSEMCKVLYLCKDGEWAGQLTHSFVRYISSPSSSDRCGLLFYHEARRWVKMPMSAWEEGIGLVKTGRDSEKGIWMTSTPRTIYGGEDDRKKKEFIDFFTFVEGKPDVVVDTAYHWYVRPCVGFPIPEMHEVTRPRCKIARGSSVVAAWGIPLEALILEHKVNRDAYMIWATDLVTEDGGDILFAATPLTTREWDSSSTGTWARFHSHYITAAASVVPVAIVHLDDRGRGTPMEMHVQINLWNDNVPVMPDLGGNRIEPTKAVYFSAPESQWVDGRVPVRQGG